VEARVRLEGIPERLLQRLDDLGAVLAARPCSRTGYSPSTRSSPSMNCARARSLVDDVLAAASRDLAYALRSEERSFQ
jgi:hypothetical protein